jgi:hypothetical protein
MLKQDRQFLRLYAKWLKGYIKKIDSVIYLEEVRR